MLLSVIVPSRNRSRLLGPLLDSLIGQENVDFEWEVIVVDNASNDDTAEVVQNKIMKSPINIRYVYEAGPGLHFGRHRGAREATGEILGYLDDDMIVMPSWIKGVKLIVEKKADAVAGRILARWVDAFPPSWMMRMMDGGVLAHLGLMDLGDDQKEINPFLVFGGNFFIAKDLLFTLGGFNPDSVPESRLRYRGDGETALMTNFLNRGYKAVYDPISTVYHIIGANRISLEYLCKRDYRQGISQSFTDLRYRNGLAFWNRCKFDIKIYYNLYYRAFSNSVCLALLTALGKDEHSSQEYVMRRLRDAYYNGYRFHRNEVKGDPELYKYVLQDNFLLPYKENSSIG
jgi:Glycosyltransferases involved in cell wall biogenesis